MQPSQAVRRIDADVSTALGRVRAERASWSAPIESVGTPEEHWLELSLLPRSRSAEGCFPDQWGPRRFERIGAMFFLPAHKTVRALSECRVQSSIVCVFRPDRVREFLDDAFEWTDERLQRGLDLANPTIRQLLFRLGEELRNPGFGSDALIELVTAQIALELGRHFRGIQAVGRSGGLSPWRLRLVDERLAEGVESPSLSELANICGLSVRQLARGFRSSRGCSLGTYIAGFRVEQAKRMLAGDHSIKSIAYATGFGSPSSFCVAFRRATGETPRIFRQRIGGGASAPRSIAY